MLYFEPSTPEQIAALDALQDVQEKYQANGAWDSEADEMIDHLVTATKAGKTIDWGLLNFKRWQLFTDVAGYGEAATELTKAAKALCETL